MAHRLGFARAENNGLFTKVAGPFAVVRVCNFCKHTEKIAVGFEGAGRGYGMREGNKARGRMLQHIKAAHPAEYARKGK